MVFTIIITTATLATQNNIAENATVILSFFSIQYLLLFLLQDRKV